MMLSIPSGVDLRGHAERMAGIHAERKRRGALRYMRDHLLVQLMRIGGA